MEKSKKIRYFNVVVISVATLLVSSCGVLTMSDLQYLYNATLQESHKMIKKETGSLINGSIIGIVTTQSEAKKIAEKCGYPYYKWDSYTGQVYGYTSNPN